MDALKSTCLVEEDEALRTLAQLPLQTPVVVDWDETLLLDNSSERFLDSLRPALAARLLLWLLDVLPPWRWLGGPRQRDTVRVAVARFFFPWALRRWRRLAPQLATERGNQRLLAVLRGRPVTVSTFGFTLIVRPLLDAMLPEATLVACGVSRADRARDECAQLAKACPTLDLSRAAVITDSEDDEHLLRAAAAGALAGGRCDAGAAMGLPAAVLWRAGSQAGRKKFSPHGAAMRVRGDRPLIAAAGARARLDLFGAVAAVPSVLVALRHLAVPLPSRAAGGGAGLALGMAI